MIEVIHGDCLEVMKTMADNSIDVVVTDPPYGLSFMGKKWDYDVPSVEIWKECLRILKPGGYLLAFAGTRTQHRMAVRIEDAGFEIRDMIAWVYGSGFPKSLNIGKAVDKLQGNEREVVGERIMTGDKTKSENFGSNRTEGKGMVLKPGLQKETKGTSKWEGWGTALKPALEPITVARKPLDGNVAENCLKWGVGGINIDGCRIAGKKPQTVRGAGGKNGRYKPIAYQGVIYDDGKGRFPANLIHDGSDEVVDLFPNTKGKIGMTGKTGQSNSIYGKYNHQDYRTDGISDSGSAARFFYTAKASSVERDMGCDEMVEKSAAERTGRKEGSVEINAYPGATGAANNFHPTVKPLALMEYLVKLVTREGQTVIDPFAGSGTTLLACKRLGRNCIGIERDDKYIPIIQARVKARVQPQLL